MCLVKCKVKFKDKGKGKDSFNSAHHHKGVLGDWRYSSMLSSTSALDGGEWSASRLLRFTSKGRSPWYPLDKRLDGPESQSGRGGEEKNSQPLPGLKPPDDPARSTAMYH
jgi:hypothetical protein